MSAILDFYDVYNFETYIHGFLDLEYPIFDPKHGFLSSVEADIISFGQRRQPFAFSAFYVHPLTLTSRQTFLSAHGTSPLPSGPQNLEIYSNTYNSCISTSLS